jgi:hypothetical protein
MVVLQKIHGSQKLKLFPDGVGRLKFAQRRGAGDLSDFKLKLCLEPRTRHLRGGRKISMIE